MEAVETELNEIIKHYSIFQYKIPTHARITPEQRETIKNSKLKIVCGTNLFRMQYWPFKLTSNPWKIEFLDISFLKNSVLFGIGTTVLPEKKGLIRKTAFHLLYNYSKFLWGEILAGQVLSFL